jgi:hypothetical protein
MARVIFEGFANADEARAFGMRVLTQIKGYVYSPGQITYDGDLMCEVIAKPIDSGTMTLVEDR